MRYLFLSVLAGLIVLVMTPVCVKTWKWSVEKFKEITKD